jgi:hypothetical protein
MLINMLASQALGVYKYYYNDRSDTRDEAYVMLWTVVLSMFTLFYWFIISCDSVVYFTFRAKRWLLIGMVYFTICIRVQYKGSQIYFSHLTIIFTNAIGDGTHSRSNIFRIRKGRNRFRGDRVYTNVHVC